MVAQLNRMRWQPALAGTRSWISRIKLWVYAWLEVPACCNDRPAASPCPPLPRCLQSQRPVKHGSAKQRAAVLIGYLRAGPDADRQARGRALARRAAVGPLANENRLVD